MLPRRFALVRHVDYTGVSGIGVVAHGVVFSDGHVALRWSSEHPATSLWDSLDDLLAVHGHGDATSIEWLDPATDPFGQSSGTRSSGRRARRSAAEPSTAPSATPPPPAPSAPEANGARQHTLLPAQRGTGRHRRSGPETQSRATQQIERDGP